MQETHEKLARMLQEKNSGITYEQALTWVELLWGDFESTYAKAGHEYMGIEMTEKVVRQWIDNYGGQLHEFVGRNPKYKHLLAQD
ncbi:YfhJ family protein [Mesobacillus subterraneus]|uniref:YfhJ family protein n=1 Tax=Mesobacillus subterraneus TaxID=285983 RepID=UPI001CFD088A|nr:YfhJ family protein [Mesobacillus subterraneus]WLR54104.1 YfhJ family protein [Mesobacillus subterraneus]